MARSVREEDSYYEDENEHEEQQVCHQLVEKSIDEKSALAIISALRLAHRNVGDQDSLL